MPTFPEDDTGSLEKARARLYTPGTQQQSSRMPLSVSKERTLQHMWKGTSGNTPYFGKRHMRLASVFFTAAFLFFIVSLGVAGYLLYYGGNAVSIDKVSVDIQGPTTIAGGDTVPLSLIITNKNAVAVENATIEIDFPDGTRSAADVQNTYPRYIENLGTLASGATVTRSVKVILFGGAGEALTLPVSLSYGTAASNAVFVKKTSYALAVSSTPLSVSVDAPTEIVAGKPFTLTLTARSNATVPLNNVVLAGAFPFGFSVTSSSVPLTDSSFLLGTLSPNTSKIVTLTGVLIGQDNEQRVFHFTIGTAKTADDSELAVTYLTQDATVTVASPFINTTLAVNGDTSDTVVVGPGSRQSVSVSYTNTLPISVMNATVAIAISGSAIDYSSIQTSRGFYRSSDHTIVFSRDTDPSLATLAPGASGIGVFTFSTLASSMLSASPMITFTVSASGTQSGQTSATEDMSASTIKTVKVATSVALTSSSLHNTGSLNNIGPIPPRADQATTYTIVWNVKNSGSSVAGGTVSATLPSYVSYTGVATGGFSYNESSHSMTWSTGDLAQGTTAQGAFQVSLTPSTSQKGMAPMIASAASFSGYDRFAGVKVSARADAVTTETKEDLGYTGANAIVQ
ncbi:MAG: hypothetical protein WCS97_02155 [Candidatus Paceibacterota bacterium]|jgi:hypothetical protein